MSVDATDERINVAEFLKIAKKYDGFTQGGVLTHAANEFLSQFGRDATIDDVGALSLGDLAHLAYDFWSWASNKHPQKKEIRLIEGVGENKQPLGRDILEIVGPDAPFLVDSIMGEIGAQGVEVRAMFHPIVDVIRDDDGQRVDDVTKDNGHIIRESMIQVHLPSLPQAKRDAILMGVRETLNDVSMSVKDFRAMKARMKECIAGLAVANVGLNADEISEYIAFLKWIEDEHFIFIGARSYNYLRNEDGTLSKEEPDIVEDRNLGILRDPLRSILRRSSEPTMLTDKLVAYLEDGSPLVVAKSNLRSKVHRRAVLDYIGIKKYDEKGKLIGEERFVGLFTAEAYDSMVRDVPLLRRKIDKVIKRAGFDPGSHNDKKFRNIVENYPRDELFQIEEDDLLRIAMGVQHLMDRPRTAMFARRDQFNRFLSILVFVPRDKYNTAVRMRVGEKLAESYGGRLSSYYPLFGDAPLARIHYIIGINPYNHLEPDLEKLESDIIEITRTWDDDLDVCAGKNNVRAAPFIGAFPAGYKEKFSPSEALLDIQELLILKEVDVWVRAYRMDGDKDNILRCKLYKRDNPVALSEAMPIFESMGLYVESEAQFKIKPKTTSQDDETQVLWVHDVEMRSSDGAPLDFAAVENSFEDAFAAIFGGTSENDGFNRLILKLGITWRQASLIRAFARWRGQTGLDPSQAVQEQALADYPLIAQKIIELFETRFDPALGKERDKKCEAINTEISTLLNEVPSLDADRVLRRITNLINNMVRTNYYQKDADGKNKPYISFKIATSQIAEVPNPKPFREIWVYSPLVEGAHLRFGPVARGGLRWSDRRDDFRTEVLGLVKAQQVKNAVIVPVGSKGAFFPKALPKGGTREEFMAAGIAAYKIFLCGLLDITDNIDAAGKIIAPKDVVRLDSDDPYLVVAADKGTATFSDIANSISLEYGHWLGDAFASGGSNGYDHKKMGITAKGGWEAVKRHFREMGHDTQSEEFNVVGVGDMSGDVFGNGMLLSEKIRLVAAFDHRDIFIDPNPDCAKSFAERKRLFELPRSSWQDYNKELISKGGGIFPRSLKSITLTPEIKELLEIASDEVTPFELMTAILKANADLLWFGGIGTYIKSKTEANSDVGDKANDAIRINGSDLRVKVIGEGANLGVTQLGRIEAAKAGVRLNTDAIDNSAGVDSSDHEVNIKILLNALVRSGAMTEDARDALLVSMTDDVAHHVLEHNYNQTLALSLQQINAANDADAHERFMVQLEELGQLNRAVEFLPAHDEMRTKIERGEGLTRPELAVLMAYSKIQLFGEIVASHAPDDEWFEKTLVNYFPEGCHQFEAAMRGHRLRREIIATVLANRIVDIGGITFMDRVRESAIADTGAIVKAYAAARKIFELDKAIEKINAQDLKIPAALQYKMMLEVQNVIRRQTYWLARRTPHASIGVNDQVTDMINSYGPEIAQLKPVIDNVVSPYEYSRIEALAQEFINEGAPKDLAHEIANLRVMISSTDIVDIAKNSGAPLLGAARIYHAIGAEIGFDEMRHAAGMVTGQDHWDKVATRRIIEDFMGEQAQLTGKIIDFAKTKGAIPDKADKKWSDSIVKQWFEINSLEASRATTAIKDLKAAGGWSFAKLTIANTQLKDFVARAIIG